MAMTFAERMALRKKEQAEGKVSTPLTEQPAEPTKKVFGKPAPKPAETFVEEKPAVVEEKKPNPFLAKLSQKLVEVEPTKAEQVEEEKNSNKMESYTLSNIITLNNIAGQAAPTEGELLMAGDMPEDAIRIKQRIALLSQCDGQSLKSEMDELKKLIKAAPEACQFLLPAELGQMVRALRSMTDNKLAIDMGRAKPRASKKAAATTPQLSAADLASALDDL